MKNEAKFNSNIDFYQMLRSKMETEAQRAAFDKKFMEAVADKLNVSDFARVAAAAYHEGYAKRA